MSLEDDQTKVAGAGGLPGMQKAPGPKNQISIIMTVKNETKFLINVLRRLCSQPVDQLIIVDGGSVDDHIGLIKILQDKYKFEYIVNDAPQGSMRDSPFGAFLKGIPLAKYEYVSLWSCDDDPSPQYIDRMKNMIEDYAPPLIICSADVERENMMYQRILFPFDCYVSPECMERNYKTFKRRINLVGSVIKKSIILGNMEYLTKVNFDATYFFHTAFDKGFMNIGVPQIRYRSYLNSHGQLGKLEDILIWETVSKARFKRTPEVFERAMNAGFWDNLRSNHRNLNLVPKMPLWLRRKIYDHIYAYDSKEEK